MANGNDKSNDRVTVAILGTEMGHIKALLVKGFDDAKDRDEKMGTAMIHEQARLNQVILRVAVQDAKVEKVEANEKKIDELKTDVIGLKAVSQKWGVAGMSTSIGALLAGGYAAIKAAFGPQ